MPKSQTKGRAKHFKKAVRDAKSGTFLVRGQPSKGAVKHASRRSAVHVHTLGQTVVFQAGNSLAIRLVGDCKLPKGTRVRERREGSRIILEPVDEWPAEFLAVAGSWTEDIPRPDWTEARDPFA